MALSLLTQDLLTRLHLTFCKTGVRLPAAPTPRRGDVVRDGLELIWSCSAHQVCEKEHTQARADTHAHTRTYLDMHTHCSSFHGWKH